MGDRNAPPDALEQLIEFTDQRTQGAHEVRAQEPTQSTTRRVLHYVKICFLTIIWLIFTISFMFHEEFKDSYKLIVIKPDNSTTYNLNDFNIKDTVRLRITAPFNKTSVVENKLGKGNKLMIKLVRVYYDDSGNVTEEKDLTDIWYLTLVKEERLQQAELLTKEKKFNIEYNEKDADDGSELRLHLSTNLKVGITVETEVDGDPVNTDLGIIFGTLVLLFLYVLIIWEIINRTLASIIASTLALGILSAMGARPALDTIIGWIDIETFLLLFSMMILVAILSETGIFDYCAVYAYKISAGNIWSLILCLGMFSALMSALLDNVTIMLLVTPITIRLCEVKSLNPIPVIMCLVMFSNVGAALTPVGDPPNVIISTNPYIVASGINFLNFILHMLPGVLLGLLQTYFQLRFIYRSYGKHKPAEEEEKEEKEEIEREAKVWENAAEGMVAISQAEELIQSTFLKRANVLKSNEPKLDKSESFEHLLLQLKQQYPIKHKILLVKASISFLFVVVLFVLHSVPHLHHLSLGWASLLGALLLLILADVKDLEALLERIEWSTLMFFASLIILMEALTVLGVINAIGQVVVKVILLVSLSFRLTLALIIILWVSAVASAFLDNIPVATMMIKIVIKLATDDKLKLPLQPLVWALAFGCCFGGNGTLIGASANVVSSGIAEQHGYKLNFLAFFRIGFPVMIGNIITATCYILFAHIFFKWHPE